MKHKKIPDISVIIPVRGEEASIEKTLSQLTRRIGVSHEILVVDDHIERSDHTVAVVSRFAKKHPDVSVVRKKSGDGDGLPAALSRGVAHAKGQAVVFVMADGCDEPGVINGMWEKITKGYDVVCGSRYAFGGGKTGGPVIQSLLSGFLNRLLYATTGVPTRDATNAFKMYRRDLVLSLVFDPALGFAVSMDVLFQAYFSGANITEIPTRWTGRKEGISKFKPFRQMVPYGRATWSAMTGVWKRTIQNRV